MDTTEKQPHPSSRLHTPFKEVQNQLLNHALP